MRYWILPWNRAVFNLPQSLKDFGFVDWRQKNKLAVGDIVFLYCSSPVRQIKYMMRVSKVNIPKDASVNDLYLYNYKYMLEPSDFYARFELIAEASDDNFELSYSKLKDLGVNSQLQGGIKVPDAILPHILENFCVVFDELSQTYREGASHSRSVTTYERNSQARAACLSHYGYSCQICGFNFEQKYGQVGKEFIHVHHIEFIAEAGGTSHDINPVKELIPVCPNCHAMLHRKCDGKYLSPSELKAIISEE